MQFCLTSEKFSFHFLMFFGRGDKNKKLGNDLKLSLLLWIFFLQVRFKFMCEWNSCITLLFLKKKLYGPFLWMGFKCLKATEPLRGDNLLFTTRCLGGPSTHLIDLRKMKCWVDLRATQWFWTQDPWIGNQAT